ncbi:argininosuccinate lyase [Brevibacillus humidisoli]|uniref:argininosuccinate lyase n=1 Tax=Brevibacillus humidisoli TaxID=2895522 RepID=UPI001E4AE0DA|nr:lyase family protein [Brevibacillus humidisoli]UFJ41462.1 argininosuccinate lyase [Brevibacillus humidisoli]
MTRQEVTGQATDTVALTGRISSAPTKLLHDEILEPQFRFELEHLLPSYILIEKVMLLEYVRMGLIPQRTVAEMGAILELITPESLTADPKQNMSDIAFAIERFVENRITDLPPVWHADRSRNDFQACAQLMFARQQLIHLVKEFFILSSVVKQLAERTLSLPMPGYTHYQSAQIVTPGFYFTALNEQLLSLLERLLFVYDGIDKCPFGAGAMAGMELPWDREHIAALLGFSASQAHALVSVASREWVLRIAAELSNGSVTISRFVTDLIYWGSSECGFIDLPDSLSGISSAMPQKKNFPVLERIRGKAAHLTAYYMDFSLGQRNTAYTNLVETSKESGRHLLDMFTQMNAIVKLLRAVLEHLQFEEERMRDVCRRGYFGGFSLANLLSLHNQIPYRSAQVIAGRYIVQALEQKLDPTAVKYSLLQEICQQQGFPLTLPEEMLYRVFDVEESLHMKQTKGSTNPEAVDSLLQQQQEWAVGLHQAWQTRERRVTDSYAEIDALLLKGRR